MDLDGLARVAVARRRVIAPNDGARRTFDLDDLAGATLHHDVAVGQHVQVVDLTPRHLPFDLAICGQNDEALVALETHPMLGDRGGGAADRQGEVRDEAGSKHGVRWWRGKCPRQ